MEDNKRCWKTIWLLSGTIKGNIKVHRSDWETASTYSKKKIYGNFLGNTRLSRM